VHERPDGIDDSLVASSVTAHWSISVGALEYLPVGFGGYHWRATDQTGSSWFVTVAVLPSCGAGDLADLTAAMDTAAELAAAGLDFVVAPVRNAAGQTVARLGARYAISVFPYLDGVPGDFADAPTDADRAAVIQLVAALHGAALADGNAVPVRPLPIAGREVLENSLRERDQPWCGGPFAEPARALVAEHADQLTRALERFDELVVSASGDGRPRVITHGEPHPGNLLRVGPKLLLLDWDTVGLAPPERDLWSLLSSTGAEATAYTELTGTPVTAEALELYRLRWILDDMSLFLAEFRAPHRRSADTEESWTGLTDYLHDLATPS
jgi:spectinomycin phosphotransferase